MSDEGRKRFKNLAERVRAKVVESDEARHKKGLLLIELMARDLKTESGLPDLVLSRDAPSKFRLNRARRNGEISLEWQRDIGAAVMTAQRPGEPRTMARYILDETTDVWRRMEGEGEIYEDMETILIDCLYQEGKQG